MGGPVPRRILCALLVRPGSVVPVDSLLDAAWGDHPPPSAERTLTTHITRLRDALARLDGAAPPGVEREGAGYRLIISPDAVDAVRFERILAGVKDLPASDVVPALREALALWRRPGPFADLHDTAYPAAEASRLAELHGSAVEALVAALLDRDDPAAAAEAEARVREDPYREPLWELLVLALYRQGRQGDALAAYQRARAELSDGLGVDPGPRLRELEQRVLAQDPTLLAAPDHRRVPCPYKGLARYDTDDADVFVGRERLVDELLGRLVDEHLVVVVGPSGAGKSSLVRAGLVPALTDGALPGSAGWSVVLTVPASRPLDALDAALAGGPDVVVLDQAEEALLADGGSHVIPFSDRVLDAVDSGVRVVLVLRADFFGLLAGHSALARRAGPATVLVGLPDEQELRRIVLEPAARVGLRVEPALVDLAVAEVRDRPGALPVLSTALVRTWEHRDGDGLTVASYRAGGGVTAALQRVGEEAWAALADDDQRAACRRLLLRLAVSENGTWVRRWVRRAELVPPGDAAAAAALAVLTDRRLVVARAEDLGIAHEALLTGWPRLRAWLEDGRTRAGILERLAAAATAWDESGRDQAELFRGTRLQAALDVATASPGDLTPLEHAFVTASSDDADRRLKEQRARADREARGRRRARLVAAVLAVTLAFAASAGAYAIIQQQRSDHAALTADASRLGALARAGGDYDRSLLLAAQAVKLDPSPEAESALFATLLRGDAVTATMRAAGRVHSMALTPDSRSVVAVTRSADLVRWPIQGGQGTTLAHLDGRPGESSFNGVVSAGDQIAATADGRIVVGVAAGEQDAELRLVDASTSRLLHRVPVDLLVGWALSVDRRIAVAAAPGSIRSESAELLIWDLGGTAANLRHVPVGGRPIRIVGCGDDLACVVTDRQLVRIRLSDAGVEGRFALPPGTVDPRAPETTERLVASRDGRMLAIASAKGALLLLDARTGRLVRELATASQDLHALAFSPDGSRIVAADNASVLVRRTNGGGKAERHDVHAGRVVSAEWSADGSTLATLGRDGDIVLLDMTGRRRVGSILTDALPARTTTMWPTPSAILLGQFDGTLVFVDPRDGTVQAASEHPHSTAIDSARAGRSGNALVTADGRGETAVWDLSTRRLLGTVELPVPPEHSPFALSAWVSPDGTLAATIHDDSGPMIFDLATRKIVRQLPPLPPSEAQGEIDVQGWTPDGSRILIARPSDVLVVDAVTGAVDLRIDTKDAQPGETAADPTGRYIAIGTNAGTLLIVDATDGHALAPPLQANDGPVLNVSLSPNGRYISTAGQPPRLTVWDTRTFRQVGGSLPVDVDAVDARARFAPDGRLVVTSGSVLRAFTMAPDQWLVRACRLAGRTLTREEFEDVLPGRSYEPACA